VNVIAVDVIALTAIDVPVATLLMFLEAVPFPVNRTVTVEAVLNTNPAGALRTISPKPISPAVASVMAGPVRVVHVPAATHPAAVLESMALPPVARVTLAAIATPLRHNKLKDMSIDLNIIARQRMPPSEANQCASEQ